MTESVSRPRVIIVGAGTAALLVADRIADQADVTILEAGPDAGTTPPRWLLDDLALPDSLYWNHIDVETGKPVLRGRVTGGCSSINGAAALRGQPYDFEEWRVPGWGWAQMRAALAAIEADHDFGAQPGHGADGPIPIHRLPFSPIDDSFVEWAVDRGHAWVPDHNAPGALGIGAWPTNMIENGRRWAAHAAIMPGLRDRIALRTGVEVRELLIEDGICMGVTVATAEGRQVIDADHVVLAAGAVGSPAILLRSGIGPPAVLTDAGVPVRREAPGVGTDLQDHPWLTIQVPASDPDAPGLRHTNGALLRYEVEPDDHVEVHLYPHHARPYIPSADPRDVLVGVGLMRAVSRGSVQIDADGEPVIRLRHLSAPADRRAFESVFADARAYIADMVAAGVFLPVEDAWWEAENAVQNAVARVDSYGHLIGTCRMGTDPASVVDETLAVRGLSGVSVIDASIMPVSPRANTMLASFAVGWHGGGILRDRLARITPLKETA
ncbi:MAG: GMC oxidoreductase [Microbacterium pygmaeum]